MKELKKRNTLYCKFLMISVLVGLLLMVFQSIFFFHLSKTITKQNEEYVFNSVDQTTTVLQNIFTKIEEISNSLAIGTNIENYLLPSDDYELYKEHLYFKDTIYFLVKGNDYIQDVALYRADGRIFYHYNNDIEIHQTLQFHRHEFENTIREPGFDVLWDMEKEEPSIIYVQPVRYLTRPRSYWGQQIGCLVVILDKGMVLDILKGGEMETISGISLINEKGEDIISTYQSRGSEEADFSQKERYERKLSGTEWYVGCTINQETIRNRYIEFRYMFFLMAFIAVILFLALFRIYTNGIVKPLSDLYGQMEYVTTGGLKKRITLQRTDEIGYIAEMINNMLDHQTRISYQMLYTQQHLYEKEIESKENELRILENQINPHFILNTLQCICGMAIAHDVPAIADISVDMSAIFRYSLRAPEMVTLREELETVKHYLHIVDVRFGGRFQSSIETEAALLSCSLPKMLVQPMIENAVSHGMEEKEEGHIEIRCMQDSPTTMKIMIRDDGKGMEPETLKELKKVLSSEEELEKVCLKVKRVGIANSCLRIKRLYGEPYGMTVESFYGEGTRVCIFLPCIKENSSRNEQKTS